MAKNIKREVLNEWKIGEYYYEEYDSDSEDEFWITKVFSKEEEKYLNASSGYYGDSHFDKDVADFKIRRRATSSERAWLDLCIKAKKFVPRPVVMVDSYDIF